MTFSSTKRAQYLSEMANQELDLFIIGGGITGAGIALDSSLRGMKVGLVEMQDFAAGTSSRSTKLVHGGLRYLKQLEIGVVAEVGKERSIVYENAPHVTTPEWMVLPFYKGGTFGSFSTSIGLKVYDFLAQVKKEERRYMLNREKTLQKEPLLKQEDLRGSGVYVEYRTDDARLTIETMKEAAVQGTIIANYAKVEELIYRNSKIVGVKVRDLLTNKIYEIFAKKIVNATGPWVDDLREKDHSKKGKHLLLTKGVHIVFDQSRFPLHHAIYFDTPDGRMVFAIPREGKTYLGTTDTVYEGDIKHPRMTKADLDYLLNSANAMFPSLKLIKEDVESSWAGLRPLIHEEGKSPSEVSRKDEVFISDSGLISIAGGKLTGYRKMGERVVDIVSEKLQSEYATSYPQSNTKNHRLSGGNVGGSDQFVEFVRKKTEEGVKIGLTFDEAQLLSTRYGSNVDKLYEKMLNVDEQTLPKSIYASLLYGIEEEMVLTPLDFFLRRTGALLFNKKLVLEYKEEVIKFMAKYFNWNVDITNLYTDQLEKEIKYTTEVE